MNSLSKNSATWREAEESSHNQGLDNYLQKILKGVPKSHIYRILRSGEVRVNSGRVEAASRVQDGEKIRLPPVRPGKPASVAAPVASSAIFVGGVLLEDEDLLIIDKPSGVAVHGGSGISSGVIESLRLSRPGL